MTEGYTTKKKYKVGDVVETMREEKMVKVKILDLKPHNFAILEIVKEDPQNKDRDVFVKQLF